MKFKKLPEAAWFLVVDGSRNAAFRKEAGQITRCHDGAVVTDLFRENEYVIVIDHEEAILRTRAYRRGE